MTSRQQFPDAVVERLDTLTEDQKSRWSVGSCLLLPVPVLRVNLDTIMSLYFVKVVFFWPLPTATIFFRKVNYF